MWEGKRDKQIFRPKAEEDIYDDIIAGRHGDINKEILMGILDDCKKKGIPFWVTNADGSDFERIV
jgi:hypothetical protein